MFQEIDVEAAGEVPPIVYPYFEVVPDDGRWATRDKRYRYPSSRSLGIALASWNYVSAAQLISLYEKLSIAMASSLNQNKQ